MLEAKSKKAGSNKSGHIIGLKNILERRVKNKKLRKKAKEQTAPTSKIAGPGERKNLARTAGQNFSEEAKEKKGKQKKFIHNIYLKSGG
ncbi:MAG: hypothetical protein LBP95_05730 [Deltaproteobacteria bacterium]|jgi:hypothetical protein|nr:hypothetical protein [Deltaproteobacteria bacterium]